MKEKILKRYGTLSKTQKLHADLRFLWNTLTDRRSAQEASNLASFRKNPENKTVSLNNLRKYQYNIIKHIN